MNTSIDRLITYLLILVVVAALGMLTIGIVMYYHAKEQMREAATSYGGAAFLFLY